MEKSNMNIANLKQNLHKKSIIEFKTKKVQSAGGD